MVWQGVEIGTEGQASEWALEDVDVNDRIGPQVSKAEFWNEPKVRLVGQSSLGVVIRPSCTDSRRCQRVAEGKNEVNVLAQIHQRRRDRLARWPIRYVVGGEQVLSH